ncbi:hypothetical protein VNI00_005798 [Paramarasmius palmivorus]|uniref:RRM domain-containing protein n=1 Tax=Paramarasmius palmivorus TaxID=297713 RepID=A0AAW0DEY8_9AGAR
MNVVKEINRINEAELKLGGTGSWHDEYKDSARIFVGGLHFELTEGDVITIFSQYGEIMDIHMPRDKETGKPKGFAFLMYEDQRSTILAVDNLNGAKVLERTLRVDHVKQYRQPRTKGEDGEWIEPEEENFNARPEMVIDEGEASDDSSASSGPEIDPEDPMRDYLLEKRREEKAKKKSKKSKSKGKHKDETPEERRARKERKREKKAKKEKKKSEGVKGVEALLASIGGREGAGPSESRRKDERSLSRSPRRSVSPRRRHYSRSRSPPPRRDYNARSIGATQLTTETTGEQIGIEIECVTACGAPLREKRVAINKVTAIPNSLLSTTITSSATTKASVSAARTHYEFTTSDAFTVFTHALSSKTPILEILSISLSRKSIMSQSYKARKVLANDDCIPAEPQNTVTDRLNDLLRSSGTGYVLKLCQNTRYVIQAPIRFTAPGQEISTVGYPVDDARATLVVSGPVVNGTGHTAAVEGNCNECDGIKLRNIQIEGNRAGSPIAQGGANIEMGGPNSDQLIEYVKSHDPRGWSCLHVTQGPLTCNNATVQNNEIGPCGTDQRSNWADGISLSCANSVVRNNVIRGATDGGIVVFGAPGSQIYNNTVEVGNYTQLGGINLVDYSPYHGNYTGTVVRNNTVLGAYADTEQRSFDLRKGENRDHVFIKVGIAIGPRVWFGNKYGSNVSSSGLVEGNRLSGGFGYGIAVTSAHNFTVRDNVLFGNTSFFAERGPNCSHFDTIPSPAPFVIDYNITSKTTVQPEFEPVTDGDLLICIVPPQRGNYWPIRSLAEAPFSQRCSFFEALVKEHPRACLGTVAGLFGLLFFVGVVLWAIRKWYLKRAEEQGRYLSLPHSPVNTPLMREEYFKDL